MATYYKVTKEHSGRTAALAAIGVSLAAFTAAISADVLIVNRGSDEDAVALPFTVMVMVSEILVPVIGGLASSLDDNN